MALPALAVVAACAGAVAGSSGPRATPAAAPKCRGERATMVGTARADRLVGTSRRDVIVAGAGDDVVLARAGRDVVCAKSGKDRVVGGGGDDAVDGGAGDDAVDGGAGADRLNGARGNDRLAGREGDDVLVGGPGQDRLRGGPGADHCSGGPGNDSLRSCESGGGGADETPAPQEPGPQSPPVDQPPLAINDTATVAEDPHATAIPVLANDTDPDGGPKAIASATQPTNGEVQVTGAGSGLAYRPDPNYCNDPLGGAPDSFTYTLAPGGSIATVSVTVTCVNDAPVNLLPAGPLSVVRETDTPLPGISIGDVDAGGDDVEHTLSVQHGTLTVDTAVLGGVGLLEVANNGTATLTITASQAQINTTLADADGLVYHGNTGYTGPDTLTVTTDDLGNNGAGGALSDTDTLALNVTPPNAAPVAAPQSVSTNEDVPKTITLSASDANGNDPLSFAIASGPSHGSLGTVGAATCNHLTPNACTANVLYTPDGDYNGTDSFTFTANDGIVDSAAATVSITVNAVNDAPKLQNIEAVALAYSENAAATPITATTTVSDDSPDFASGTLTVDYSLGGQADDRLEIRNQGTGAGQIGVSGSNVSFGGTTIGTFTGGTGTTPLVVTLSASASPVAAQALVRNVTYRNVSDNPSTAMRTARLVLTDGDGGTSAPATRAITVDGVDDAPVVTTTPGSLSHVEGEGPEAIDPALTIADVDSTNMASATVQITGNYFNGQDVLAAVAPLFGVTPSFNSATGTLTLTGATTVANYQTILRAVTYENTSQDPATTPRTVTFKVNDGTLESAGATRGITVIGVP